MSYATTQATAASLIASKGQAVTLTYHAAGTYDLATNAVTLTDTTEATTGVVLPLSRGLANMPGSTISIDDQRLLLPGTVTAPTIDTTATIDGKDYVITQVSPLNPGGTSLMFDCIIRGVP